MNTYLIIEPNTNLTTPYSLISENEHIVRTNTVQDALEKLLTEKPTYILLSASFSLSKIITFLDSLKNSFTHQIIPIIFVVDFNNKINTVPGITWGGYAGIVTSLSSKDELDSTIRRISSSQ